MPEPPPQRRHLRGQQAEHEPGHGDGDEPADQPDEGHSIQRFHPGKDHHLARERATEADIGVLPDGNQSGIAGQ